MLAYATLLKLRNDARDALLVHPPVPFNAAAASASQSTLPGSRPSTPPRDAETPASTPNGGVSKSGTVVLDCVGCGRPVRVASFRKECKRVTNVTCHSAFVIIIIIWVVVVVVQTPSNRYAIHLSSCISDGTGTRRAAVRNATSKSKYVYRFIFFISLPLGTKCCKFQLTKRGCRIGSDAGRSASPYPGSENGNVSDHYAPPPPPGPKKKGRPPKNKPKGAPPSCSPVLARARSLR